MPRNGRRVLMIAYYFPPIGGIGSIRVARFAEYLSQFGWEPWVVAPAETPHALDASLGFGDANVIRSPSLELVRRPRKASPGERGPSGPGREADASPQAPIPGLGSRRLRSAAGKVAQRTVLFPDPQVGWYPGAVRTALRVARTTSFDAIFSSSFPITAHLVARTIRRRTGLPWVAEFRDPWADELPRVSFRVAAAGLEKRLAKDASEVVMPSPTWAQHYGEVWGRQVEVITNGCDPTFPVEAGGTKDGPIAHVGSYWPGKQDLTTVWQALADMRNSSGQVPRVRWVGELPEKARLQLDRAGLAELVDVTGFVSQEQAIRLMASASVLVAAGPLDTGHYGRGWLPAKLFEYLASGLPVLYIGDRCGDAGKLLAAQPNCWVIRPGDVEGAVRALRAALTAGRGVRDVAALSRYRRAAELAEVLNTVAAKDQAPRARS